MRKVPERTRLLVLRRAGWRCERCGWRSNQQVSLDMSHRKARGMGGSKHGQDDPALYNALCRHCHQWVESNPFEARRYGYKVARDTDCHEAPYRSWQGWLIPDSSGSSATHECSDDGGP
jgi:hypothetical protein